LARKKKNSSREGEVSHRSERPAVASTPIVPVMRVQEDDEIRGGN